MRACNKSDIVILIPVYQPEPEFLPFITALAKEEYNIVLVDDGSDKCYQEVFQKVGHIAKVLVHDKNKGKGKALKTGLCYIQNYYPECKGVITADADGQLHYCFIAVDGRGENNSQGMTLSELSKLCEELGLKAAYNLDGGKSSAMTFGDKLVNSPSDGGRKDTDIIYIGE